MLKKAATKAQTLVDWIAALGILAGFIIAVVLMSGIDWNTLKTWLF